MQHTRLVGCRVLLRFSHCHMPGVLVDMFQLCVCIKPPNFACIWQAHTNWNPGHIGMPADKHSLMPLPGVFVGGDFGSVTHLGYYFWAVLKLGTLNAIMDHCSSGEPLFTDKEACVAKHQ
jgi:hypothetical protein